MNEESEKEPATQELEQKGKLDQTGLLLVQMGAFLSTVFIPVSCQLLKLLSPDLII